MDTEKFVGTWIAYLVVSFPAAYVWHLVMSHGLYRRLAIFSGFDESVIGLGFGYADSGPYRLPSIRLISRHGSAHPPHLESQQAAFKQPQQPWDYRDKYQTS